MTSSNARISIDLLLTTMFCHGAPDRRQHSFMYNNPRKCRLAGGAGFEVHYSDRGLLKSALFMRRNAAPHLRSLSVGDVEKLLMGFISDNFWIMESEAWDGCLLGAGQARDVPFSDFVSRDTKEHLVETIATSDLFVEPRQLVVFPLIVLHVEDEFECPAFFLVKPDGLKSSRLPHGYVDADLQSASFPPFRQWDGVRRSPLSWLGVWAGTAEIAKRHRAAILGSIALLPHRMERYLFSGRALFGGFCTFAGTLSMTSGDPHTPPLSENIIIREADHEWLAILADKLISPAKVERRQMRALEYFYRAWLPDPTRRFPTLFGALDAIYGDAGKATQSVIESIGPVMGAAYDYDRLKVLLGLRASVIHGGAPNVYESSDYQKYYERYEEDAIRDLEIIVARCLQAVIFGAAMQERPHTHAALIKQHTGRDV